MVSFGYTLSSEEHSPTDLVRFATTAEEAGFDFLSISDHYHPWVSAQGHSPFVWSVLGAIANATERIEVGVGVTCPIMRIHPAIVAHATATTSLLFEGRFFFGVGTAGGAGPRYAQLGVCWATDAAEARRTVHRVWPNGGVAGQLSQDLPTWSHFEDAATMVTEEAATESVACGPDPEPLLASVRKFVDAGYDHLYFHQIGPDQDGFFELWTTTLQPALHRDFGRGP